FIPAAATTGALMGSLVLLRRPRRWVRDRVGRTRESVLIRIAPGADPSGVISALTTIEGVTLRSLRIEETENGRVIEARIVGGRGVDIEAALAPLGGRDDVVDLDIA